MNPLFSPEKLLELIFIAAIIAVSIREFFVSILTLANKTKHKLFAWVIVWPIFFVIKKLSTKHYERVIRVYYKRLKFFAISSLIGSIFFIVMFTIVLVPSK